ncbi:MAG: hypothetical protein KKF46_08160 [Nanoarchaeota archaeon]|nr:hypothetical protein [Nanoarchaeota archaeon]MBU1322302.1 hypothetical protein [Nanoarchaeota archaeon]MBU2441094.1 hypothetical protein [Nanoarchaeota archaeon]
MTKTKKHKVKESHKIQHKAKHSEHKEKVPGNFFPIISAAVLIIILVLVIVKLFGSSASPVISQEDKAKVEFYVMSQCPYGTQVEDAFYPVLQQMGDAIDFHLDYIVQEPSPGQFQSLHGEPEVIGNIVQLCAMKYYPENYKYMDFIDCQNKDAANVHTNWVTCANQNQMDVTKLRTCLEGDEGKGLLRESMLRAQAREARGSPTIFIDDAPYQGQRDALSFQRAVCKVVEHDACDAIPVCASGADCTEQAGKIGVCNNAGQADASCTYEDPVELNYYVLNSADCTGQACDASRILQVTQQLFLGGKPKVVDVDSPEGKQLVEKYGIEVVPAFIFESNIENTKSWKERTDLQSAFDKIGDSYKLKDEATGATFYISEEARQAKYDAIGITLGDNRPQIDFFVMSYCPYGNQAEEGIEPAYQLLKDVADFNPRYVIYSNYGGGGPNFCIDAESQICSMHGIVELNQNIREACVAKHIGMDEWFEFALKMNTDATSQNADDKWESAAKGLGLDIDVINKCFDEEGEALMAADKALGDLMGVSGSPSVFVDGDSYSGGRTPEAFKQGLCAAFDTAPSECNTKLEGEASASSAPQGNC